MDMLSIDEGAGEVGGDGDGIGVGMAMTMVSVV